MTLLLTAVTPDGIVMGADSAITSLDPNDPRSHLEFNKVIPVSRLHMGITLAGGTRIGSQEHKAWIDNWLRQYTGDESTAESFTEFCNEFVDTLNDVAGSGDPSHIFQLAAWVYARNEDGEKLLAPRLAEVSRGDDGYRWVSLLPDDFVHDLLEWRKNGDRDKGYPIRFASTGLPPTYATWISKVGAPEFSKLVQAQIPYPHVEAVAEYVRFSIRALAELYRIARQPAYVGEPIETLILYPESKNMFSIRY